MAKTQENGKKSHIGPDLGPLSSNSDCIFFFFFKNLAFSYIRYHGQLLLCEISEKTNDPILRKLSDRQTNRQRDQSDVIGCCPTNVMRPICLMEKIAKIMKQTYAYKCYVSTHSV